MYAWVGAAAKYVAGLNWLGWIKALLANWKDLLLAVVLCGFFLRGCEIDDLEDAARGYDEAIEELQRVNGENEQSIADCERINRENADEAERIRREGGELAAQDAERSVAYDEEVERIRNELEQARPLSGTCPGVTDTDLLGRLYRRSYGSN